MPVRRKNIKGYVIPLYKVFQDVFLKSSKHDWLGECFSLLYTLYDPMVHILHTKLIRSRPFSGFLLTGSIGNCQGWNHHGESTGDASLPRLMLATYPPLKMKEFVPLSKKFYDVSIGNLRIFQKALIIFRDYFVRFFSGKSPSGFFNFTHLVSGPRVDLIFSKVWANIWRGSSKA